jgi:hypothetical protein
MAGIAADSSISNTWSEMNVPDSVSAFLSPISSVIALCSLEFATPKSVPVERSNDSDCLSHLPFALRHPTPPRRFCQSVNLSNSHSDMGRQRSLEALDTILPLFSLETLSFTAFPSVLKEVG